MKSELSGKNEKITLLKFEIQSLEKEVARLKVTARTFEGEQRKCNDLELKLQSLIIEKNTLEESYGLRLQALEQQLQHAQEAKVLMSEANALLKERLANLQTEGGNSGIIPLQGEVQNPEAPEVMTASQDREPPKEYKIKYTEGLNPILSAFDELDPKFEWKGDEYKSAEAAFQCEKLAHPFCTLSKAEKIRIKQAIIDAEHAREAKHIGDTQVPSTPQWERDQFKVMENIQREKFDQYEVFKDKLMETKDGIITHPVRDAVWREKFPEILVKIRDESLGIENREGNSSGMNIAPCPWRKSWESVPKDHKYHMGCMVTVCFTMLI